MVFARALCSLAIGCVAMANLQLVAKTTEQPPTKPSRTELSADADWKFLLGDSAGAEASAFDDHSWRTVSVPHDWSIEGKPDEKNPTGAGGGFFPAGVGWYR